MPGEVPQPPPFVNPRPSKKDWKAALEREDKATRNKQEQDRKDNAVHWSYGTPGPKQWTNISGFDDLKNRIRCLLIEYQDPLSILVSFDFDGTLGARRSKVSIGYTKDDCLSRQDTFNQEMYSVDILKVLNDKGVPFFVNTAAANPRRAHEAMAENNHYERSRPEMPMSSVLHELGLCTQTEEKIVHYGADILRCGHALSAGYDKNIPIDYVMCTCNLKPQVIIHVDDGIINLQTVLSAGFPQRVIGMYFPTIDGMIIGDEPNAESALEYLSSYRENIRRC
jgi:hypothetical protein